MSDLLVVQGVHKSYLSGQEKLSVLADLALTVQRGRMIAVTGASGSGKSTFLHLVGGMDRADSGKIIFEGVEITRLQGEELARLRNEKIGFVFQFHHLLPEFTALENVMFPLLLRRLSFREASEQARRLLDEVGLSGRLQHKPGELSGGEQQRVAVARALVGKPRLLLADEPTGNLDPHTSDRIYELLLGLHRRHGLTSLIATHNPQLAERCDEQKRLVDGKLV